MRSKANKNVRSQFSETSGRCTDSLESRYERIEIPEVRATSSIDLLNSRANVVDDSSEEKTSFDVQAERVGVFGGMKSEDDIGRVAEL